MHIYNSVIGVRMWNDLQCLTFFWFCLSFMRLNYLYQRIFKDNPGGYVFREKRPFLQYCQSVCLHN